MPEVFTPRDAPHVELACDANAQLPAEVFNTMADLYVK